MHRATVNTKRSNKMVRHKLQEEQILTIKVENLIESSKEEIRQAKKVKTENSSNTAMVAFVPPTRLPAPEEGNVVPETVDDAMEMQDSGEYFDWFNEQK